VIDARIPGGSWIMRQRWHNLLFLHWPVPAQILRPHIPAAIHIDTYNGSAWLSVVAFSMSGVRFRMLPPVPTASRFAELNLRTYVTCQGHSGVWFFSLDAQSTLAALTARMAGLPYHRALMHVQCETRTIEYSSRRVPAPDHTARFAATYGSGCSKVPSPPGSLEYFLTERYAMFWQRKGIRRIDSAHSRWELFDAYAHIEVNTIAEGAQLPGLHAPASLQFATGKDVLFWPPVSVP
jgi:uncharacterized protein YqjF (DUF2071 family)